MKFITVDTYEKMSRHAANIISAQVIIKPDCVLGLATGSSPLGTYKQLIDWYNKGDIDFSGVTSVNLDEYVGLDGKNEQSYRYFMNHNFFDHINISINNTFVPNGCAVDLAGEGPCAGGRAGAHLLQYRVRSLLLQGPCLCRFVRRSRTVAKKRL